MAHREKKIWVTYPEYFVLINPVHGTRHMFFVEDVEVEEGVLFVRSTQPFGGSVSKLHFSGLFPGNLDQSC